MVWNRIDDYLKAKGKTIYWLAKQTGISQGMFYALRDGKAKDIGFSKMVRIADVLGTDLNEFREEDKEDKDERMEI